VFELDDFASNDAFEPVKDDASADPFERTRPLGPVAQTHGIVVPVRVPKPQHQASRRVEPQGVNELLTQQTPGCRAQDDDALFMQPDNALIWTEIENLGEVEMLQIHAFGKRRPFHVCVWAHS
jgi:hypothetical protein